MSAAVILQEACNLGVKLRVEGDRIKAAGPRPAVERLLPALREHKPEVLAALSKPNVKLASSPDSAECSGHWLISLPAERLERWFSPAVTSAELAERYPGAVLVALPETGAEKPRPATAEEAAELTRLVVAVAARERFSDAERAEALANAMRDPEAASRCLRGLRDMG